MDAAYDVIVLGTGLKECILSGLMSSVAKKNVLHLDRNSYYGGESASLNLEQLYARFERDEKPKEHLGKSRDYCIDLCPKFLMACGVLVKILLKTNVTRYLEFRSVAGSFVFHKDKVHKVPSTPKEAMSSSLLGFFQKHKFKSFISDVGDYDFDAPDPKSKLSGYNLAEMSAADLYKKYGLDDQAKQFTGHAICLYPNDNYLKGTASDLIKRAQLYANSVARYGNSPYIYPKWGLGGLPEGFSRRCAVHGGVYMLNSDEKKDFIEKIHYDDDGMVTGVQVGGETAKCSQVIGDPSYWLETEKIELKHYICRLICILNHPIKNTHEADSCQIIIPADQCERSSDIYVCMSSFQHNVASVGKYIAVSSTNLELSPGEEYDPTKGVEYCEKNLAFAKALFGETLEEFAWVSEYYVAKNDPKADGCFITSSYDATTHFETCCKEVLATYEKIIGEPLDLEVPDKDGEDGDGEN